MWIPNSDGQTLVNSDNIAYIDLFHYKDCIVIRAALMSGERETLRRFDASDEQGALKEFELLRSQLERDHQRR